MIKNTKKNKKEFNYVPYIKSALRKIWRWTPERRKCLRAEQCVLCGFAGKLYADHIDPVVDPATGFTTWDSYITRLFCGRLQPICATCHKAKSKVEAGQRAKFRKSKKDIK